MLNYGWGALGGGRPLLDILTVPGEFKPLYLLLLSGQIQTFSRSLYIREFHRLTTL